jgi:hypothetical protein
MGWDIVRVYTLPNKYIIDYFKTIPVVEKIYLVNDLEGIGLAGKPLFFKKASNTWNLC